MSMRNFVLHVSIIEDKRLFCLALTQIMRFSRYELNTLFYNEDSTALARLECGLIFCWKEQC